MKDTDLWGDLINQIERESRYSTRSVVPIESETVTKTRESPEDPNKGLQPFLPGRDEEDDSSSRRRWKLNKQ
ncbi:hypothetical protein J6590_056921 [Homalodisca vitripennis]|nr:hypothetical protein J6590_056921 [Homalodisca vitripennis]